MTAVTRCLNNCVKIALLRCTILLASGKGFGYILFVRSASGRCLLGRFLPKLSGPHKGPLFFSLAVLPLAACAYDPRMHPAADVVGADYGKDLAACQSKAARDADQIVARHGYTWAVYWISYPLEERRQTRDCLAGKGYEGTP